MGQKNRVSLCVNQDCQRGVGNRKERSRGKSKSKCPDCGKAQHQFEVKRY